MSKNLSTPSIFTAAYWREAAANLKNVRMLALAAMIVALRVICKMIEIPIAPTLNINPAAVFNSIGAMVYGPVVGLVGGMISDPLGYLVNPKDAYFLPFMLVDMSSSFLFGLFFWKRPLTVGRAMSAKFTVNMVCNVVLTSIFVKWSLFVYSGAAAAEAYNLITLVRIAKNLILFPLEAILIVVALNAMTPALYRLRLIKEKPDLKLKWWHFVLVGALTLLSIGLVFLYVYVLKDVIAAHNIKLF